ncbi:hypothetical protein BCR33DRAFT_720275 [Rhizoclosmatium globosum]|uniref:PIG-F-domain-containing protein n=1 Tax=Rhizoclosmatium globosum TaxID=329046 RepID=A0A1Y2BW77_9FUNG|nr:hypothetical protein BCR33DRAFT_720275 [Rhizoclosmatium globosum]|eukprot:ORY39006.1 hypothetical protein BCR33DRAFT_720275 [Rhizoclosmatium globosum]
MASLLTIISADPVGVLSKASVFSFIAFAVFNGLNPGKRAMQTSILSDFIFGIKSSTLGFVALYVLAVLFGAPLTKKTERTFWTVLWIVSLSVFPISLRIHAAGQNWNHVFRIFHKSNSSVVVYQYQLLGTLIGAWVGCFCLPLDWNVQWKLYPIPVAIGAVFGTIGGILVGQGLSLVRKLSK